MNDIDRQQREHSVPCLVCRKPTWNVSAVCDNTSCQNFTHRDTERVVDRILTKG